jgi:hypothetical protein
VNANMRMRVMTKVTTAIIRIASKTRQSMCRLMA